MMRLTIKWDNPDDDSSDLAVKLAWGSHTARLGASGFDALAEMVGRAILGCLDEEPSEEAAISPPASGASVEQLDERAVVKILVGGTIRRGDLVRGADGHLVLRGFDDGIEEADDQS
jgi:hypothetical protein